MTINTTTDTSSRPPMWRVLFLNVGPIVVLTTLLTIAVWKTFPTWDDGWLIMMQREGGSISATMADRPLTGIIWEFFSQHGILWSSGYVIHWLSWTCMGLLTMGLWTTLFPNLRRYAVAVGCLAAAPVLCTIQFIIVNTVFNSQIPVLLTYAGLLILLRTQRNDVSLWFWMFSCLVAIVLVGCAAMLSDYTAATVLAGAVLLLFPTGQMRQTALSLARRIVGAVIFIATGAVGYFVYWRLADAAFREKVRPEMVLFSGDTLRHYALAGQHFISLLWRGPMGDLLHRIGSMEFAGYAGFIAVPFAVLMAAWVFWATRRQTNGRPIDIRAWPDVLILLLAFAVGIGPIVLMGLFVVFNNTWTRILLPVLPIMCCLDAYMLFYLIRPKLWWVIPTVLAFAAAYFTVDDAFMRIRERQNDVAWAKQIQSHLSDRGITVALFEFDEPCARIWSDYELTARLSINWPADKRKQFWAITYMDLFDRYVSGVAWDRKLSRPAIDVTVRGLGVKGPIARFLWVRVRHDGTIDVSSTTADQNADSS